MQTTTNAPKIEKVTTDVAFSRALSDGESEMLYLELRETLGREDYGGDFEVLYSNGWEITGVRLYVSGDELAACFAAIDEWLAGASDLWDNDENERG